MSILSLPLELLDPITSALEAEDLARLSSTCTDMWKAGGAECVRQRLADHMDLHVRSALHIIEQAQKEARKYVHNVLGHNENYLDTIGILAREVGWVPSACAPSDVRCVAFTYNVPLFHGMGALFMRWCFSITSSHVSIRLTPPVHAGTHSAPTTFVRETIDGLFSHDAYPLGTMYLPTDLRLRPSACLTMSSRHMPVDRWPWFATFVYSYVHEYATSHLVHLQWNDKTNPCSWKPM